MSFRSFSSLLGSKVTYKDFLVRSMSVKLLDWKKTFPTMSSNSTTRTDGVSLMYSYNRVQSICVETMIFSKRSETNIVHGWNMKWERKQIDNVKGPIHAKVEMQKYRDNLRSPIGRVKQILENYYVLLLWSMRYLWISRITTGQFRVRVE